MDMEAVQQQQQQYKHYYWGVPDSPIDWCENNYEISPYICEFYNTISSFAISAFAIYGIYLLLWPFSGKLQQHHKILRSLNVRGRIILSYLAITTVGIGSAFYHATLLYKHQLFDEFPMVISIALFLYCIATVEPVTKSMSYRYRLFRHLLPWLLFGYVLAVATTIYFVRDTPAILQVSFGFLVITVVSLSAKVSSSISEPISNSNPKKLLIYSTMSMLTAYISWLIERKLCDNGYVISGLQLHAIWHCLSGLASFYWMQFYITLYLEKLNYKTTVVYNWMGIASVQSNLRIQPLQS